MKPTKYETLGELIGTYQDTLGMSLKEATAHAKKRFPEWADRIDDYIREGGFITSIREGSVEHSEQRIEEALTHAGYNPGSPLPATLPPVKERQPQAGKPDPEQRLSEALSQMGYGTRH